MKLLVVILNYRVTDLTVDCLHSLAPHVGDVDRTRVAVVENGTGPEAAERLRREIESNGWSAWADLTVLPVNLGFTGGNNVVVRDALRSAQPPEYVLLLNADTLVRKGSFDELVRFMDAHPRAGVAGSRLIWPDGETQGSPFRFVGVLGAIESGIRSRVVSRVLKHSISIAPKPQGTSRVDWVSGASMILRRSMLERVGLLDEGLYTYFDDIDLCLRARRAGWETWYVPSSVVVHLEGRSTGIGAHAVRRRPKYWFEARRRFLLKSQGALRASLIDLAYVSSLAIWRLGQAMRRRPSTDPPNLLRDLIANSVFSSGLRASAVANPALSGPAERGAPRHSSRPA